MPRMNVVRRVTGAVPPILLVLAICGVDSSPAEGSEAGPPLDDVMAQVGGLEKQGAHGEALRTLISALEGYSDDAWDRKKYHRALQWAWGCFTELPKSQRRQLLNEYSVSGGDIAVPPLRDLVDWIRELMPSTTLTSLRARLPLAIWHHLEGNDGNFVGYALSIVEQSPDSLTAEYAIIYVVGVQYCRLERARMLQMARTAAKLAPNNRGAAWAICQTVLSFCSASQVDEAKALIAEVKTDAQGKLAGDVAIQLDALIGEIESSAYSAAISRLWELQPYLDPGPIEHQIDVLRIGIDWLHHRTDPASRARLAAIMQAGEQEARHPDPLRRAYGILVQARFHRRQGHKTEAAKFYKRAADTNQEGVCESALANLGYVLETINPDRAIEALEEYRRRWGYGEAAEVPLTRLARLYRKQGRYQEGLSQFQELRRRAETGYAAVVQDTDRLAAGAAGCLYGLDRKDEADALAGPLLARHGYGTPSEDLHWKQLRRLSVLLEDMGRDEEAAQYRQLSCRRGK